MSPKHCTDKQERTNTHPHTHQTHTHTHTHTHRVFTPALQREAQSDQLGTMVLFEWGQTIELFGI